MRFRYLGLYLTLLPFSIIAGEKISIDIKVPLPETANLAPAQTGASIFLMRSDWAVATELGEDVAVWLSDYERKENIIGQQVISLLIEIREPSVLRTGNLINKDRITVRYWPSPIESGRFNQKILNDLDMISNELKQEAYHLGKKIEAHLRSSLK
ncbi:MAG: hypothetical protein K9N35_01030 [Candidatus Marinimicrobia bacterium]|nr:hypothetical protein [Candidatus Neomarinimicrobiota bacterium]